MKIFSIPNYQINNRVQNTGYSSHFGLRMQEPLKNDTVSFGIKRTAKTSGIANMANHNVVGQAIKEIYEPHKKLKELLEEEFGDLACDKNKFGKQLITIGERIKGLFSARQKTGSRNWSSRDEILQCMTDLSGHCMILEDRRAFTECMNRFIKLIKSGKIIIAKSDDFHLFEKDESVILIDEDTLVPKEQINKFLKEKRSITTPRDIWYEQQFLKMSYARICKKEYYLIWDSDTVPIKPIQMFENNKPFFDMITHYHPPYFKTLNLILPGLKLANLSFVSEHIMVKTEYMKNLLDEIERNDKLEGKFFWEKIMMAIEQKDIDFSGFSEFETYGTFVNTRYPNSFIYRKYKTLRSARIFYDSVDNLNESDINWLSQDFSSLSFERWNQFEKDKFEIAKNSELQKKYKPLEFFDNFISIYRKYKKN